MTSYHSNHLRLLSLTKQLTSQVNQGLHEQALSLFHHIHSSLSLHLDPFIYPLALKSCAAINRPHLGASIHTHVTKSALLTNPFISSALVNMYGKCMSISDARKLFDEIPTRNAVLWNAMISLYTHCGRVRDAFALFEDMNVAPSESTFNTMISALSGLEGGSFKAVGLYREMANLGLKPNVITFLSLLPACVEIAALSLIKEIHGYTFRTGIELHPHLRSGLVEAYGRCGCIIYARRVFECMKEKDVVAWSSLISAYALHGEADMALEAFHQMEIAKVGPDDITYLAVLKACSHAGLPDEALNYFEKMENDKGVEVSSDHYSCLVDVLSRVGRLYEAYGVITKMPMKATAKTWGALLGGCRNYGEVELGEIAGRALFEVEPDNAANYVLLAKIYGSLGRHEEAQRMRREMKERGVKAAPGSSWVMYQD